MAFLPPEQLTLTGSCLCTAIRYTITIPPLPSRPLVPNALPTPVDDTTTVPTRLPLIDLDHCNSCRRGCGGLIQCWCICPQDWVEFTLQPRRQPPAADPGAAAGLDAGDDGGAACGVVYPSASVASNPSGKLLAETYLGHYESSPGVHRCFCSRCGTGLTWCNSKDRGPGWTLGPIVDVAVGTLDRESIERVRPDRHGWWEDGVGWVKRLVSEGDGVLIKHPSGRVSERVGGGCSKGSGA
ncbi:hypothetical protein MMYC01_206834 [Madurella mycetomatis]|uniref:Uncharacterized protein n=1 Tax=Madurella mycetomatis TaxID=100816 RepID=A0A175VWR8_9PEZI|nr:hypothetical protein MMYC01_206834 [Madurella mycetomatis]